MDDQVTSDPAPATETTPPEASATDAPPVTVMKETGVGFGPPNNRTKTVVLSPQRTPIFGTGKRGRRR